MASTDATAIPIKNQAYRVVFPILDADGDLVTGAAGLDSEISKDEGTFADCTNEATEIATASGMYYLDLTATEMNADCVAVIVKTSTVGAKTTPIVMYPAEDGDIPVNVKQWMGTAPLALNSQRVQVRIGDIAAGIIVAASFGANALNAAALATDAVTEIQTGLATSAEIATLQAFVDTEVAAIKAKTDNLPTDPADASDIAAAIATLQGFVDTEVAAIKAKTDNLPTDPADASDIATAFADISARLPAALVGGRIDASVGAMAANVLTASALDAAAVTEIVTGVLTTVMTESYSADGAAPTLAQFCFLMIAALTEFAITGTTISAKKLDGVTEAATWTLDDASTPTSRTRAS